MVVGFFLSALHGGDGFVVEGVDTAASAVDDVAFVEFHAHFAGDFFLGAIDEGLDGFALRGEPETVVDELSVFGDEAVADVLGLAVDDEGFDILVSCE